MNKENLRPAGTPEPSKTEFYTEPDSDETYRRSFDPDFARRALHRMAELQTQESERMHANIDTDSLDGYNVYSDPESVDNP